jgi:hypothetical protein
MPGGKFADDWHCCKIELDRGRKSLRMGVERAVCNVRRTRESRDSEGVHGQTDLYICQVFWLRHRRQRVVGRRFTTPDRAVNPLANADSLALSMDTTIHLPPSLDAYKTSETTTGVDAGTSMSTPKYTLPPPVYLPSSGGYTTSRLTQEVSAQPPVTKLKQTHTLFLQPFHRRVFAFRRWSIDEDGRLVCRTRHASRDSCVCYICLPPFASELSNFISRPKPYDRPSRPLASVTPDDQDTRTTTSRDHSARMTIDGPTLSRLFQNLTPLVKESPLDFNSKATAICASLGIDPVTSEEIVSLFKMQLVANGSQGSRCVRPVLHAAFS